jgi:hypothetical protein
VLSAVANRFAAPEITDQLISATKSALCRHPGALN